MDIHEIFAEYPDIAKKMLIEDRVDLSTGTLQGVIDIIEDDLGLLWEAPQLEEYLDGHLSDAHPLRVHFPANVRRDGYTVKDISRLPVDIFEYVGEYITPETFEMAAEINNHIIPGARYVYPFPKGAYISGLPSSSQSITMAKYNEWLADIVKRVYGCNIFDYPSYYANLTTYEIAAHITMGTRFV